MARTRHRMRIPFATGLAAATTALALGLGAAPAFAATTAPATHTPHATAAAGASHHTATASPGTASSATAGPTGVSPAGTTADAVQHGRLSPRQIPPARPTLSPSAHRPSAPAAESALAREASAPACTAATFSSLSGSALATAVESETTDCINTLFSLTGSDAQGVFRESQMLAIDSAFQSLAANYAGNDDAGIWQLVLYLRAGYYVQYYDPADVGTYDASLTSASVDALDAFFAGPHWLDATDANGGTLGDVVLLTDSATVQQDFLPQYQQILGAYTGAWDSTSTMDAVVYDVYTPLWRGQYNPAFATAITNDHSIITALDSFALDHLSMLGGTNTFMDADAGNDLAGYVQFTALQPTVRPLMLQLLQDSQMTGSTAALWVSVAQQTLYNDSANCSYYGTCNLVAQLTAAALPIHHTCPNATVSLAAESLSSGDLTAVCTSLDNQIPWFQNLVKATGPIPGQIITGETMNVFSSSLDYEIYAGVIFGVDTNNGGITVTGEPTQAGNAAYSVMYQAPYATDFTADIWNLNHEFTHYLDAVYDMKGDFTQQTAVNDVWWIEGIAEYTSYTYRGVADTEAVQDAALHTYNLSTLFQNNYTVDDETRTYPWGYLAVRYMWEKHPDVLYTMLGYMRSGDYTDAYNTYNSIGTGYDADFDAWLDAISATGTGGTTTACTASNAQEMDRNCYRADQSESAGDYDYLWIYLPAGTTTLTVTTSGGTGTAYLYYDPSSWATESNYTASSTDGGTAQSITVTNTTAGYRYISLYADAAFSGVTVTTQY